MGRSRWLIAGVVAVALVARNLSAPAAAAPQAVSGPVTGGNGVPSLAATSFDLGSVGYEQSEFFLSGTANTYEPKTPLTNDGKWTVTPTDSADFTTRLVVYRPKDARKFNGTVVVEWLNVSGGLDAGPDWVMGHTELVRDGFAWVGVSAQKVGVTAASGSDPARYESMVHPGDSYSYDIYSQAGKAIRQQSDKILGGLKPKTVLAVGESQSAARLITYIDAIQSRAHLYDGFLVHSRRDAGAPLQGSPPPALGTAPPGPAPLNVPSPTAIRDDLDVPVLVIQTQTDVYNSNVTARQPDTKRYRLWEIAGTSHYDTYGLTIGVKDTGDGQGAVQLLAAMQHPSTSAIPGTIECNLPINTGPAHWVINAAMYSLNRWVTKGVEPPIAPRLETATISPVVYALDANGNARGGIRTPQVDVPIAALGGTTNSGAGTLGRFCVLFGTTVPLTSQQLGALYKSHDDFVAQWNQSVDRALKAGYVLESDAKELKTAARSSTIGQQSASP